MANAFLKRIFAPTKKSMILAWFLEVVSVLLLVVQAYLLVKIFGTWFDWLVVSGDDPKAPVVLAVDKLGVHGCIWLLFGAMVGRALLAYAKDALLTKAGMTVAGQVRSSLLRQLGELGLTRHYFGSDGALVSKIVTEPDHLVGHARFHVQKMICVSTPIILALCIGVYSLTASLVLLLSVPVVVVAMALIGVATAKKSREQMDALAQLGGRFLDWIRGANTLSRLKATQVAIADMAQSSEDYHKRTMSVLKIAFLNSAVLELLSALCIALVAVYLGFGLMGLLPWARGEALGDFGTALFILLLVPEFYAPMRRLGAEYHIKGQAQASAKALAPILAFKKSHHTGKPLTLTKAPSIHLKNLTVFGDDGRIRLAPTTLDFMGGKRTALLGKSGMGKSTLLHVLLGFGDYEGDVWLDDGRRVAYHEIELGHLRSQMSYLSQTLALLPISILDNLRLACPSAKEEALWEVLDKVGLGELVRSLPNGLKTVLGERGQGLSGGQGQRLMIAQLLLQDAKIWLLDEPTEHLDQKTADDIKALLWELTENKTVIWVTHERDFGEFVFDGVCDLNVGGQR